MATFEFLMLVKESAYGTTIATPVLGTDSLYIRLTDGNSFSVQADPVMTEIMYGGGEAIPEEILSDYTEVKGKLTTKLYPSQAALLLAWVASRINSGQTAPWTTTQPPGDLASVSIYHAYQRADGTLKRTRYAGCKASDWEVACSRQDPVAKLSIGIMAQRPVGNTLDSSTDPDATEFPAPADTDLPTGPYLFSHTSGQLLLGSGAGTVRSQYDSLTVGATNKMDARPFESRFLQVCSFRGRTGKLTADLRLKATPDDRSAYEAVTAQRAQVAFTNGTTTTTFDFKGNNKIRKLTRDLPLDKVFMHKLEIGTTRDATAGTDLAITVA